MGNCCDMKGFLSFLVLRLISKKPMSGEDLRQELEKRKGTKPSAGTIYPVLKSLKGEGWIEEVGDGQKEKKYRLTSTGQKALKVANQRFVQMFYDVKEEFDRCS
jgi:DNA-binding PadR family transcriptional regulator